MKNLDSIPTLPTFPGLLLAALCIGWTGATAPLHAQCDFTITGVVTQPNCDASDGIIEILISENADIYSIDWSTGDQGSLMIDLASGYYSVTVTDWNGCEITAEFLLSCDGGPADPGDPGGGTDDPIDEDCSLKTFTQGGWGSPPNGNNPGVYLHANFAGAFPNGLTIGCDRLLHLTSAQAVTNYLPGGGQPSMLPAGVTTDPTKFKNVLAAQLVAATLNVGMDAYDAEFTPSTNRLGNAIINSGVFAGTTVQQLLDMANAYIGGCGGAYTASQYNDALSSINENFVGGNTDNGFLSCNGAGPKSLMNGGGPEVKNIFPNPASSTLTARVRSEGDAVIKAELLDMTGRVVSPQMVRSVTSGSLDLTMDISPLGEGLYFLRLSSGGKETISRIVVAR